MHLICSSMFRTTWLNLQHKSKSSSNVKSQAGRWQNTCACKVSKESGCRRRDEQHYLILFGGESSRSNIISAKCLLPDPHHHCQQDSIPYPSHIDSTNPVHLSSVNKQVLSDSDDPLWVYLVWLPLGVWICFAYYPAAIMYQNMASQDCRMSPFAGFESW